MSRRVDLPDGGWADIVDPKTVSVRKRNPVMRATMAAGRAGIGEKDHEPTEDDWDLISATNAALIVALVKAWSFGDTVTLEDVVDLPGPVFDALATECMPHMKGLFPDFGPTPDPASPTEPSSA